MRVLALLLCLFSGIQSGAPPLSDEDIVRGIVIGGSFEGKMARRISPLGDAAAVMVIKILGEKDPSAAQGQAVLLVLRISFADTGLIRNESDRDPRAALFLLKSMESAARSSKLHGEISETRKFLLTQREKLKSAPKQ